MKTRHLTAIGIPPGDSVTLAAKLLQDTREANGDARTVFADFKRVVANPAAFVNDEKYGPLAKSIADRPPRVLEAVSPRGVDAPHQVWGTGLEPDAVQQLKNACKLPIAVSAAL